MRITSCLLVAAGMPGNVPGLDPARKSRLTVLARGHCTPLKGHGAAIDAAR